MEEKNTLLKFLIDTISTIRLKIRIVINLTHFTFLKSKLKEEGKASKA